MTRYGTFPNIQGNGFVTTGAKPLAIEQESMALIPYEPKAPMVIDAPQLDLPTAGAIETATSGRGGRIARPRIHTGVEPVKVVEAAPPPKKGGLGRIAGSMPAQLALFAAAPFAVSALMPDEAKKQADIMEKYGETKEVWDKAARWYDDEVMEVAKLLALRKQGMW